MAHAIYKRFVSHKLSFITCSAALSSSALAVDSTARYVAITPRVGLAYTGASGFGVWGRTGADFGINSYVNEFTPPAGNTLSTYAVDARLEALGTFAPRHDVVITAGPSIAKGITRWSTVDDPYGDDYATRPPTIGLTLGAGLYL